MAKSSGSKGKKKGSRAAHAPAASPGKRTVRATAPPLGRTEIEGGRTRPDSEGASVPDYEANPNQPPTRRSDRPEFDDSDRFMAEGMSTEAAAVDSEESLASLGSADRSFSEIAAGTAVGAGIDRGTSTGTGGLAAGEDLDPVAEGDYWRQLFRRRPYFEVGRPYEDYEPGYRYGWESAAEDRFAGRSFDEVEDELERHWADRRGENSREWGDVREIVRDAFDRVRGRATTGKGSDDEPGAW